MFGNTPMSQDMGMFGHFFGRDNICVPSVFNHNYKSDFVFTVIHGSRVAVSDVDALWTCLCSTGEPPAHSNIGPKWYSIRPGPRFWELLFFLSLCNSTYVAREFSGSANPSKGSKKRK